MAVGDVNGDGLADLVVANAGIPYGQGGSVDVLLGNGDGTFQAAHNYVAAIAPIAVALGDFNGDGIADLAVANSYGNNVSVLLGQAGAPSKPCPATPPAAIPKP